MIHAKLIYDLLKSSKGVCTDSRKIFEGCIFFALKGDKFNGNKFAAEALNRGAIFSIIDEEEYSVPDKTILVKDTLATLQNVARIHRKKLGIPILAITGTNGKTTTKELIAAILGEKFNVTFTEGNLNNHIGVPLTLLNMNETTDFGVVEMGANHPGEIAALCSIADPDYGIITNIGKAHLEGFGSFEGVKNTKAELYSYLHKKNGTIFYHKDNPILAGLTSHFQDKISYGTSKADFTGELLQSPPFVNVKANFPKGILYLNTHLIGNFNFDNVLAAACVGNYFGVNPLLIQQAIKNYHPQNIRSQLIVKGTLKIIMDAYNANPTSMQASINSFISAFPGNRYLILGDMLELGAYSQQEHKSIIELIDSISATQVFLVGPRFAEAAGNNSGYKTFSNVTLLCDYLKNHKLNNGNVLIKGSRGIQLEKILDFLN